MPHLRTLFRRIGPSRGPKNVGVRGDEDDPCYAGYTCIKGREHWKAYNHPDRLLKPLKRMPDGSVVTISSEDPIDEVADRLRDFIDRHGPQSVAMFWGNHFATEGSVNLSMYEAFMKGIGSPMAFSSMTIDSPGKIVAKGFFGMWGAPGYGSHDPEVALLIGSNLLVSHFNPIGHPRNFLKASSDRGGKLILIDPRRSDTAKRATIHLQATPGTDALILGAMCRIVLAEGREDAEFIGANVQ
jgi:anaerobic selenocysteine-containing dehydrogenase